MLGRPSSTGKLILVIALLVLIGFPMVYVLWEALNLLLAGDLSSIRYPIVIPVLAVFVALLVVVAKLIRNWEQET